MNHGVCSYSYLICCRIFVCLTLNRIACFSASHFLFSLTLLINSTVMCVFFFNTVADLVLLLVLFIRGVAN